MPAYNGTYMSVLELLGRHTFASGDIYQGALPKKKPPKKDTPSEPPRPGLGHMAGKSWEFAGETKDWDNFWEHKFIRTQLVTGWSAQEGGPGASSHQREEQTQTYLRRPCGIRARGLQTLCVLCPASKLLMPSVDRSNLVVRCLLHELCLECNLLRAGQS